MLSGIFQKRKKIQELRAPTLQDIKKFREIYGRHADRRHIEAPSCFEKSIYKAISCQKELHSVDFRQEDVTDPQIIALAETLIEMPMVSSLDLRDNRITDDGAKALLEVLRLQIIAAKTPPKTDPKSKKMLPPPPVPEYTRYVTNVNLKGNEISQGVLQEMVQYTEILKREDKRLEIRAALSQTDRNTNGGIDDEDFKAVVKLLTGTEPSKKEIKQLMSQSNVSNDTLQNAMALENVLLAKCSSSPSKNTACPPWEAIVQVRHASIGPGYAAVPFSSRIVSPMRSQDVHDEVLDLKVREQGVREHVEAAPTATVSSSNAKIMTASPTTPGRIPPVESVRSSNLPTSNGSSPPKTNTDFRPPSSPPPPLPLSQLSSADKTGAYAQLSQDETDQDRYRQSNYKSPGERVSSATVSTVSLARQDSNDSRRNSMSPAVSANQASPSPRDEFSIELSWKDDDPFTDDEDSSSPSGSGYKEDVAVVDDAESRRYREPVQASSASRTVTGSSARDDSANQTSRPNTTMPIASNFGDSETDDDVGRAKADSPNFSSLQCLEATGLGAGSPREQGSSLSTPEYRVSIKCPLGEENDIEEEEQFDAVVIDVLKDGKPRNIAKITHTEFKRGLPLQDYPGDVPFRNLVALVLSHNGLRDLSLFRECRFPCALVLDLSSNILTKVADEELACFPKLQVVDLSKNRLKTISGLGRLFDLKALNLSNNAIRTVINIEHLVHLQILRLRANAVSAATALRLLSLNKLLTHLDLDDNPLVEVDDRQRRKLTVHILNIIPTLTSLGSVPVAGYHAKEKRKVSTVHPPMGKSLLEHDECQSLRATWASVACDILQIVQDKEPEPSRSTYDDDDPYGEPNVGSSSPTKQKKLSREEQRQKDELRSKAVGYRSRAKAPPSPVRPKSSPYEFGQPLHPKTSPKKKRIMPDPKLAQEQKRRASELSAPKHPPIDTVQLKQEQRRKSRPTFDVNMSVAERLQLVREKSLRRTSTSVAHSESVSNHRSSTQHNQSTKRRNDHFPAMIMEIRGPELPKHGSPKRGSTVEFRVEPFFAGTPQYSRDDNENQRMVHSQSPVTTSDDGLMASDLTNGNISETSERKTSLKESNFLQSLAVSDFLSHAEEEISTAVTALNVLLSMCLRSPNDPKKLSEYRISLEALDILNERESQELFMKAKQHDDPTKIHECTVSFERLCALKKSIKDLLDQLENHEPGSPTIRSFCNSLRSTTLRSVISPAIVDSDASVSSSNNTEVQNIEEQPAELPPPSSTHTHHIEANRPDRSPSPTLSSLLFSSAGKATNEKLADETLRSETNSPAKPISSDAEDDFDFLSSDSMFDNDASGTAAMSLESVQVSSDIKSFIAEPTDMSDETAASSEVEESGCSSFIEVTTDYPSSEETSASSQMLERTERSHSATSTDITQEIQHQDEEDDIDFDFDTEVPLDIDLTDGVAVPRSPENVSSLSARNDCDADLAQDEGSDRLTYDLETYSPDDEEQHVENGEELEAVTSPDVPWGDEGQQKEEQEEEPMENVSSDTEVDIGKCDDDACVDEASEGGAKADAVAAEDEDDEEAETFGDWEKGFDPNTNHYFWFNHATGESQWVPPECWPYEVDTPFEDDAEYAEDDMQAEEHEQATDLDGQEQNDEDNANDDTADGEDDIFSDQDLPDF